MLKPRVTPTELMQHVRKSKLFDRVLGKVNIISLKNGDGLAEFTVQEEHTNRKGELHPGFVCSVADYLSSYSFSTHELGNNYHVSVDMQLTFYKPPARMGDEVEVISKTLHGGHSITFLEVLLKNKNTGQLLAKGNHNMYLLHPQLSKKNATEHAQKVLEQHECK
ncbi:acyl-coenzyme A thioesterase 13-like isoform X2 [Euwallacea fornicatus]|uniref:acyl-coenzyme A thioesterase 13-like isoform X2 n=1 Tax=Euwallacea fornicatus TaxID=995702 RepID=UPI00338FDBED